MRYLAIFIPGLLLPSTAWAAEGALVWDATQLSLWWCLPFFGILLSLAFMPLAIPNFWHHHYGKISLAWALATIAPLAYYYGIDVALHEITHTYMLEFIPFIILISALYTISGGIRLQLACCGTPLINTGIMLFATLIASWIGTAGAAMLFIRPLLIINEKRWYRRHIVIFFILLVCNLGGSLTALGDPPLFLGFLKGVDFFWPTIHLFVPFIIVTVPVLIMFYCFDVFYYAKEEESVRNSKVQHPTVVKGRVNFLFFGILMAAVIMSGNWKPDMYFEVFGVKVELQNLVRDIILIMLALASLLFTARENRTYNMFTWLPVLEVAKLFAAIFITAMPVLAMLDMGTDGALASLVRLVSDNGVPNNTSYFWITGMLSAFLDNAPTYLVFFHMAGGDAEVLMGPMAATLVAISAGSVFMGALTYIGNAPNFLVKSIAEINHISMPSFFGYLKWSCGILLPIFFLLTYIGF